MATSGQADHPASGEGRLEPRRASDTQGDTSRVLAKLEQSGKVNDLMKLLANSDSAFRPFVLMSDALLVRAVLPPVVRELVILHLAAVRNVRYQWDEHVVMGRREGVTDDQLMALGEHRIDEPAVFSTEQRLALRVAAALGSGQTLPLDTWREMAGVWGTGGALDLVFTIGWWGGFVPLVVNAVSEHGLGRGAAGSSGDA